MKILQFPAPARPVADPPARDVRDRLVMEGLDLVEPIAKALHASLPPSFDIDDIIQNGMLGLLDAATKYNASLNVPFGAYARTRIRGAILDSVRRKNWVESTRDELTERHQEQGRQPDTIESIETGRMRHILRKAIATLPDRERDLIETHYLRGGLLQDTEALSDVGASRISQIHRQALDRLREALALYGVHSADHSRRKAA